MIPSAKVLTVLSIICHERDSFVTHECVTHSWLTNVTHSWLTNVSHAWLIEFHVWKTYSKFKQKIWILALSVCFPNACSSAGRKFAASKSLLKYYSKVGSFPKTNSMRCCVNLLALWFLVRPNNTQSCLNMTRFASQSGMGWLWLVGSIKL